MEKIECTLNPPKVGNIELHTSFGDWIWTPQDDITTSELAELMPLFLSGSHIVDIDSYWNELSWEMKRHWSIK